MKIVTALSLLMPLLANAMAPEQQIWNIVDRNDKNALAAFLGEGKNPLASARGKLGRTLLHDCARNFKPSLIPLLVAAGADVNDCNNAWHTTPLMEAVNSTPMKSTGQNETVSLLLALNADPTIDNNRGQSVLEIARLYGADRDFVPELKVYIHNYKK